MTTFTVRFNVVDLFDRRHPVTQTHNASTPHEAYVMALNSVAGQYVVELVAIVDETGQAWNTFNERV